MYKHPNESDDATLADAVNVRFIDMIEAVDRLTDRVSWDDATAVRDTIESLTKIHKLSGEIRELIVKTIMQGDERDG